MFAKNLTSRVQVLNVQEFDIPAREYCIHLEPNGCTELIGLFVTNKKALAGLVEFRKQVVPEDTTIVDEKVASEDLNLSEEVDTPSVGEVVEDPVEPATESVEMLDGKFICNECGAEFASSRGLASHKARVHENQ